MPDLVELRGECDGLFHPRAVWRTWVPGHDRAPREGRATAKRLVESRLSLWSTRGHVFALPHDVHPVMLMYRADLVESLGIDVNELETWDDFVARRQDGREGSRRRRRARSLHARFSGCSGRGALEILLLQQGISVFDERGQRELRSRGNGRDHPLVPPSDRSAPNASRTTAGRTSSAARAQQSAERRPRAVLHRARLAHALDRNGGSGSRRKDETHAASGVEARRSPDECLGRLGARHRQERRSTPSSRGSSQKSLYFDEIAARPALQAHEHLAGAQGRLEPAGIHRAAALLLRTSRSARSSPSSRPTLRPTGRRRSASEARTW